MAEDTTNAVAASKILPIHKASIHRICSGQGILDLAGAVKELVENSLDAGANRIDIRLKEFGADLIEVADNGPGVSPQYFQALTLNNYTSKFFEFADLQNISSFGFRGEALSSLCASAKVTITTRTADDQVATRLEYDHSGLIVSQTCVARCVGTTVSATNLFCPSPARLEEFRHNVKPEYARLVTVLQAYALISKRVRLLCTNQTKEAGRTTVIQIHGSVSIRENIVGLFGIKSLRLLEWIDLRVIEKCRVEGFLSKPKKGTGCTSRDRQFCFINGRPVDFPKLAKSLDELYRSFNPTQYPIVVINFTLPTTAYDINVSPDKRKVFIHAEGNLIKGFIAELQKEYGVIDAPTQKIAKPTLSNYLVPVGHASVTREPAHGSNSCMDDGDVQRDEEALISATSGKAEYSSQQTGIPNIVQSKLNPSQRKCGDLEQDADEPRKEVLISATSDTVEPINIKDDSPHGVTLKLKPFRPLLMIKSFRKSSRSAILSNASRTFVRWRFASSEMQPHNRVRVQSRLTSRFKRQLEESGEWPPLKKCTLADTAAPRETASNASNPSTKVVGINEEVQQRPELISSIQGNVADWSTGLIKPRECDAHEGALLSKSQSPLETGGLRSNVEGGEAKPLEFSSVSQSEVLGESPSVLGTQQVNHEVAENSSTNTWKQGDVSELHNLESGNQAAEANEAVHRPKTAAVIKFDMKKLQMLSERGLLGHEKDRIKEPRMKRSFMFATVGDSSIGKAFTEKEAALQAATKELEQNLRKADFKHMQVLGQFDLRFILAKLDDDIFIVDQHASDEVYNFERLMRTGVVNSQLLPRPVPLELEVADEVIVVTHMKTFRICTYQHGLFLKPADDDNEIVRLEDSATV